WVPWPAGPLLRPSARTQDDPGAIRNPPLPSAITDRETAIPLADAKRYRCCRLFRSGSWSRQVLYSTSPARSFHPVSNELKQSATDTHYHTSHSTTSNEGTRKTDREAAQNSADERKTG